MSRMDELLPSTARELQAGRAPLNAAWLDDHHVSLDEAIGLASHLTTASHVYRAQCLSDCGCPALSMNRLCRNW